jgi:hypothetical protein
MGALLPALVVAAAALVGFVLYRAVMAARERKAERARELAVHGFRPVVSPDPQLVERILALHRTDSSQRLEVRDLYRKETDGAVVHLFRIVDRTSDSPDVTTDGLVAVGSPTLHLPRFSLTPRIEQEGTLATMGNWLLERLAARTGPPVEFPSPPAFRQRYTLVADDEQAARRFFTPERLARLAETHYWMVRGEGDTFTLDRLVLDPAKRRVTGRDLIERLADADRALEIFRDAS